MTRMANSRSTPGRRAANTWDPAKEKPVDACKPFGAAAIMRVPGRVHLTWTDEYTLRIDTDAGQQARRLQFGTLASRGWRVNGQRDFPVGGQLISLLADT